MASSFNELKQVLRLVSTGMTGLEMIGDLIAPFLSGKAASIEGDILNVMRTIHAIVSSVKDGADGKVSTDQVEDALTHLRAQLAANDRATQAEIDAKFPPG